ncbi:unnamed protein product [Lactuca virosa]|uniref:Uncharacterized protein n=1 Tax=Lactuca virosa TaxID=75947 RepID=A0AAU9P2T7_9ASTR|nr:unnamed protein product [Lactuca virosa]
MTTFSRNFVFFFFFLLAFFFLSASSQTNAFNRTITTAFNRTITTTFNHTVNCFDCVDDDCSTSSELPKRVHDEMMFDFLYSPKNEDFLDLDELDISQSQSIDDDKRVHGGMLFPFLEGKDLQSTENPMVEEDGLLSKNRKLDGFLGRECNSASSTIDHKSSGEQQLVMENVKSNQSKAARANSHDECAKDEMMNINENSKEEDVEHNHPKVSLCDAAAAAAILSEDENAGGDFTTVSLASSSCLSKQGDKDFATWPHRNVEDQISISQSQSDDIIQSRVDDEMLFGFLKRKNSLHELQAIEPTFTEVEHEQSGPTWIKSAASESDQTRIDGGVEFETLELPIDCKSARGSSQQTSGINKSLELGISASYNPKEGMEVNGKDDDLKTPLLNPSDAVAVDSKSVHSVNQGIKTITFKIGGIEYASCSSSNESLLLDLNGVSPLQGQGVVPELVDVKAIKETIEDAGFEVNSKKMLDPVTMCPRESDGLALNQSSECCILVKPKQLKFDEMDGCDSNKVTSLLSRIRELLGNPSMNMDSASLKDDKTSEQQSIQIQLKSAMIRSHEDFDACTSTETKPKQLKFDEMDGCDSNKVTSLLSRIRELLGNPSMNMDSASLKDDKSSEQQSIQIQLKSAMIRSHEDFDACTSTETMNIDLDLDLNPLVEESLLPKNRMVEDVEHNPMVSLHDDAAVYCEPAFTEVESEASEYDDVGFTVVDYDETVTPVSKCSSTQHQVEDFYYEDMDISTSADYEDMDISTSADYDSVTIADYSYPTQQQTDDSLPFNWQTKHFCSSPVDLGNLWDRSTSTSEGDLTPNITSFVPHPQKQAAAVWPGRRGDIKVKAEAQKKKQEEMVPRGVSLKMEHPQKENHVMVNFELFGFFFKFVMKWLALLCNKLADGYIIWRTPTGLINLRARLSTWLITPPVWTLGHESCIKKVAVYKHGRRRGGLGLDSNENFCFLCRHT